MTPTAPPHQFDIATDLTPLGGGRYAGHTAAEYANMVGPFGGITTAILLRAVQRDPRHLADPLTLTVNFAKPITPGPFAISAEPVRTNRRTQHWTITMRQDEVVTTTATAVVGARRPTWSDTETAPPAAPPADTVEPTELPGLVAWLANYEFRFVEGPVDPNAGPQPRSTTTLWVRDKPARPLDYPALAALSDIFIPRVMIRHGRYIPAGTVALTVYFHADHDLITSHHDEPVLATARAHHFGNGYADQHAQLWTSTGHLLATSHQLVYFTEPAAT